MSIARITAALCVLATLAPGAALAQPNTGSSGSDSAYCKTLKSRATMYNDIARDPSQPRGVRQFYANRAAIVLLHARQAGCAWATTPAAMAPPAASQTRAATRSTSRTLTVRTRLGKAESARKRSGTTTRPPRPGAAVVAARISASPTGSGRLDQYCTAVAGLIEEAENAGDTASTGNDTQGADEWYELADHMTDTATRNGCRFSSAMRAPSRADGAAVRR